MRSITCAILTAILFMSSAFAMVFERQLSVVPAGSITTVTSIYTSIDTRVISPTVAVWTDASHTTSTTFPIITPTPSIVTSVSTKILSSSVSTTSSMSSSSSTSIAPTTITVGAAPVTSSATSSTTTAAVVVAGSKHTLGTAAYGGIGIGIGGAVVIVVVLGFLYWCHKRRARKPFPRRTNSEIERREQNRWSLERRRELLRQYISPGGWSPGQGNAISKPTIPNIYQGQFPRSLMYQSFQPQRPARPTSDTDSEIAALQHGPPGRVVTQDFIMEENGVELEETNQKEEGPLPLPYDAGLPVPERPRASSYYSQTTAHPFGQPYISKRSTINTTAINNAIDSTLQDYTSGSVESQQLNEPSATGHGNGQGEDKYAEYRAEEEDTDGRKQYHRNQALAILDPPKRRDTAELGVRMTED